MLFSGDEGGKGAIKRGDSTFSLKKSVVDKRTTVIFLLVAAGSLFLTISPVWFVLLAAIAGLVLKNLEERAAK